MTKNVNKDERYKLLCEKVLNESWSEVSKHTEEIQAALEKSYLEEEDLLLIKLAARAFLQRALMERADSVALFDVDPYGLSACGQNLKEECPCDREVCILNE